jgi:HEAT repeat protein
MPVTMQQVLAEIDKDEPIYANFEKLGKGALPHLQMLVESDDNPLRSAKAAWAASVIGGAGGIDVMRTASDHHDPQVRIAVAHGLQNLSADAPADLMMKSLGDADSGVRKLALSTAGLLRMGDAAVRVAQIEKSDPEEHLRKAAAVTTKVLSKVAPAKKASPK